MKLIVGLGNPGARYRNTRHNAGFICVDQIAQKYKLKFTPEADTASEVALGAHFILAKPQTFMNNSGVAVAKLLRKHNISPADLWIIYDDVDLPVGAFRIKPQGSSSGQKGMQSIIEALSTNQIARIRIGIGRVEGVDTADHVLAKFTPEELEQVTSVCQEIVDNLEEYLDQ